MSHAGVFRHPAWDLQQLLAGLEQGPQHADSDVQHRDGDAQCLLCQNGPICSLCSQSGAGRSPCVRLAPTKDGAGDTLKSPVRSRSSITSLRGPAPLVPFPCHCGFYLPGVISGWRSKAKPHRFAQAKGDPEAPKEK